MGGELSLRRISLIRPRRWEDTLDKRGIEKPDKTYIRYFRRNWEVCSMGSMSTFLRTPFSKGGLKCTNIYEGILTKYIHNSKNHHYRLQQLQLNKTFINRRRHLLSLIRYLSYTILRKCQVLTKNIHVSI